MAWLIIALIAYFLFSLAQLTDKFLVVKYVPKPLVYTFLVGSLGIAVLIFLPWAFFWPSTNEIIFNLLTGAIYAFGLFFLYSALVKGEASRVITLIGAISPLIVLLLSYLFWEERLAKPEIAAFAFLIGGGVLISWKKNYQKNEPKTYLHAIFAAVSFGIFYVLLKQVYLNQPFFSGLIWTRLGTFIAVLPLMLLPQSRKDILNNLKSSGVKMSKIFVGGQIAGATGFVVLNYAYALASAALVNALQGFQYTFLFLWILIFGPKFPQLKEKITKPILIQKIIALLLVGIGLFLLVY